MDAHTANRTHREHLRTRRTVAGLLRAGEIVRAPGGWAEVTSVRLAPDHAAVVVVTLDGDPKPRRYHCDEAAEILDGPGRRPVNVLGDLHPDELELAERTGAFQAGHRTDADGRRWLSLWLSGRYRTDRAVRLADEYGYEHRPPGVTTDYPEPRTIWRLDIEAAEVAA